MSTSPSTCHPKRRYAKGRRRPSIEQRRAALDRAQERRMAQPAPVYPPTRRPGEYRGFVWVQIDGIDTIVQLHQGPAPHGRRPRCDRFESRDGDRLLATGGLHQIVRQMIAQEIPRPPSLERYDEANRWRE